MGKPYEMCKRYAAGELTREELVDLLVNWDYEPIPPPPKDIFDDLRFDVDGSFHDVEKALLYGLIDDNLFDEVGERRSEAFLLREPEK